MNTMVYDPTETAAEQMFAVCAYHLEDLRRVDADNVLRVMRDTSDSCIECKENRCVDEPFVGYTPGEDVGQAEHPMSERRAWSRY